MGLGAKSKDVTSKIKMNPDENIEQLRHKARTMVKHRKIFEDKSDFDNTVFGFTLPNSEEFISDNVPMSSIIDQDTELCFKKKTEEMKEKKDLEEKKKELGTTEELKMIYIRVHFVMGAKSKDV